MPTLEDRVNNYMKEFPNYSNLYVSPRNVIEGIWVMGNIYKTSGYYGAYPYGYLKRMKALFYDISEEDTLHIFSGSLDKDKYNCVDIHNDMDCHHLSSYFPKGLFKLIYADPPYSFEDAIHYGTSMVNRNKVLKECGKLLDKGGLIVWLDQVLPMYKNSFMKPIGYIGMVKSTNHRFRVITIFEKQ
jgi:hypothetical protein